MHTLRLPVRLILLALLVLVASFTRQRTTWPDGEPIHLVLRPEQDSDTS